MPMVRSIRRRIAGLVVAVVAASVCPASLSAQRPGAAGAAADGTTALHLAVRGGDVAAVGRLLRAGADVNAANRYGVTPLSLAAQAGDEALLGALFAAGADVARAEAGLPDGQTLLMHAARSGRVAAVDQLIRRGARLDAVEARTGTTALMWAAVADRGAVVTALAKAGADLDVESRATQYPHTPPAVIGDALEAGVSYVGQTVLPKGRWTAAHFAAREGALEATTALAAARANLNRTDPDGASALMIAVINGHYDVASALLRGGADPNIAERTGATPLYAAVEMHTLASTFGRPDLTPVVVDGAPRMVGLLLEAGANPNARLASRVLKRVYNAGDARLGEGATPFMRAARGGDVAVMRRLLAAGADPGLTQANGNTPLILAAAVGGNGTLNPDRGTPGQAIAAVALCLDAGADVNALNAAGDTALHVAAGLGRAGADMVRFLLSRGANPTLANRAGRTPLDLAMRAEGGADLVPLLQRPAVASTAAGRAPAR